MASEIIEPPALTVGIELDLEGLNDPTNDGVQSIASDLVSEIIEPPRTCFR